MKHLTKNLSVFVLCFVLILVFLSNLQAQPNDNIKSLKEKFESADSIVIISHEITVEYGPKLVHDWDKKDKSFNLRKWNKLHPPLENYLYKGKLNRKIIKESFKLRAGNRAELLSILLKKVQITTVKNYNCDEPRHSIIIYKNMKQSYLDICFSCKRIHTSRDIDFSFFNMDENKWESLKNFFQTYEITDFFLDY